MTNTTHKTILLTGGGTAGHVTPNLALLPQLRAEGFSIHYIGTVDGIERELLANEADVSYHAISAGKLRRYFSLKNFTDPFRVVKGIFQAKRIMKDVKPDVVFSKGGYVSVPVAIAARKKAPIITHESDYTPGLANRITARFADTVCVTFEDTLQYTGSKGVYTGTPIRRALFEGQAARGLAFTGFSGTRPVLLVMGGSQGAQAINDVLRAAMPCLTKTFDIIHLCGKGKLCPTIEDPAYRQYEYISEELPDLLSCADIILSRAGANAVFEFLALAKPALLIPLPCDCSRGDQVLNAKYFARKGYAITMDQADLNPDSLCKALDSLYESRLQFISTMSADTKADGTNEVMNVIRKAVAKGK